MKLLADEFRNEVERECGYDPGDRSTYFVLAGPIPFVGVVVGSYDPEEDFCKLRGSFLPRSRRGLPPHVLYVRYDSVMAFFLGAVPEDFDYPLGDDGDYT